MKSIKIILTLIIAFPLYVFGQCFTFTITTTPESCLGCCDGSISVTNLTGGCPPYQLTWSPSGNTGGGACSGITYTLTIKDAGSCCRDSSVQVQVPVSTTDIDQISSNKMRLNIYPNPTNGNFIVETNSVEKQIVQIFDVAGKMVLSQNINGKANIDASNFDNGIYFIQVKTNQNTSTQKIIVQH